MSQQPSPPPTIPLTDLHKHLSPSSTPSQEPLHTPTPTPTSFLSSLTTAKPLTILLSTTLIPLTILTILQITFTELAARTDLENWQDWLIPANIDSNPNASYRMAGYPRDISIGPLHNTLQMVSAYYSLVVCCFGLVLWWYSVKKGGWKTTFIRRLSMLATFTLNPILLLASAIYTLSTHATASQFDENYVRSQMTSSEGSYFRYSKGTFDLESWACGTKDLPGFDRDGMVQRTCSLESGARVLTVLGFGFSAALAVVVWLDWRGAKLLMRTWKDRRASWREDYV